jgi:hypothetical protein
MRAPWYHIVRRRRRTAIAFHMAIFIVSRVLFYMGVDLRLVEMRVVPAKQILNERMQVGESII